MKWKTRAYAGRHSSKGGRHSYGRVKRHSKTHWRKTGKSMGTNALGGGAFSAWGYHFDRLCRGC